MRMFKKGSLTVDEILINTGYVPNMNIDEERKDLAAAFRWAERSNLHEAVANHFSLAVDPEGTKFLMNPNMWHFSRIKASDLLLLNELIKKLGGVADQSEKVGKTLRVFLSR